MIMDLWMIVAAGFTVNKETLLQLSLVQLLRTANVTCITVCVLGTSQHSCALQKFCGKLCCIADASAL